jgi:protein-tyrosine-phosphatase
VLSASAGGPPDPAAIGAVMRRHGLTRPRDPRLLATRRDDMTDLIVGLDRRTLAPWHRNVLDRISSLRP